MHISLDKTHIFTVSVNPRIAGISSVANHKGKVKCFLYIQMFSEVIALSVSLSDMSLKNHLVFIYT